MGNLPYVLRSPRNRKHLWTYIKKVWNLKIPNAAVCKGHISPFDFLADVYFEKVTDCIVMGNRGSGKTLILALLDNLNSNFKKNCETGTVGAIESQAQKCYKYFKKFLKVFEQYGRVKYCQMKETVFNPPLNSIVQILIGTMAGLNSPHPQKCYFDEVELAIWERLQEFLNMSKSNFGIKAQNILISTRKKSSGTMERLINEREEMGFDLYVWCIWEVIQRCTEKSCDACKQIIKGNWEDGSPRSFYSVCKGKAKRARNGHYLIFDAQKKFKLLDRKVWEAQIECKKPVRTGSVFYWYDSARHWITFDVPDASSKAIFYEALDWGGADPNVCTFWFELDNNFYCYDEIYRRNIAPSVFAEIILARRKFWGLEVRKDYYAVAGSYCDPSSKISRLELERAGIKTIPANNDIIAGIDIINSVGSDNRIYNHKRCVKTNEEFTIYSYPPAGGDKPVDKNNHCPDTARYFFIERNPLDGDYNSDIIISRKRIEQLNSTMESFSTEKLFGGFVSMQSNLGLSKGNNVFFDNLNKF